MITDHHCHLQDPKILPHLHQVISNAAKKEITQFICCGTCEEDWQEVLDLSKKHEQIIPAIGIHPWFLEKLSPNWQVKMGEIFEQNPDCLIGEIGLDLHFCKDTILQQINIFRIQMKIAKKFHRSVSIHNLKTWHLLIPILKKYLDLKILLHSYSGSFEITKQLIEFPNVFFSFSGTILESSSKMAKIINQIPINKILLETDSPFLLPKYDKITNQKYNEPANMIFVLEKMAKIKNIGTEILSRQLEENSENFLTRELF